MWDTKAINVELVTENVSQGMLEHAEGHSGLRTEAGASRGSLEDLPKLEKAAVHQKGVRKRLNSYCGGGRVVERRQPPEGFKSEEVHPNCEGALASEASKIAATFSDVFTVTILDA